jgi:hypothetical protein
LVAVLVAGALLPAAAQATRPPSKLTATTVTGRVTGLGMTQIAVSKTSCSLRGKTAALAAMFAVGENVTIACVNGALKTIKLAPPAGPSHTVSVIRSTSTVIPKAATPGSSGISIAWSSGAIFENGTVGDASAPVTVSASGAVSAFDASSITVAGVACPFRGVELPSLLASDSFIYTSLVQHNLQIGSSAKISCTYTDTSSQGSVSVLPAT